MRAELRDDSVCFWARGNGNGANQTDGQTTASSPQGNQGAKWRRKTGTMARALDGKTGGSQGERARLPSPPPPSLPARLPTLPSLM